MPPHANSDWIIVEKNGITQDVSLSCLQELTGARYIPYLDFVDFRVLKKVVALKKGRLESGRLWLSAYFKKEILGEHLPPVSLRWINDKIGWGVFAEKDFEAMEFIAEYSGKVRARSKNDSKNAYCFEYLLAPSEETPYLIDAQDQGGISRYINHHPKPNLSSTFTLVDSVPHIILYTAKSVAKGEELSYDYGPDYWKKRSKPTI